MCRYFLSLFLHFLSSPFYSTPFYSPTIPCIVRELFLGTDIFSILHELSSAYCWAFPLLMLYIVVDGMSCCSLPHKLVDHPITVTPGEHYVMEWAYGWESTPFPSQWVQLVPIGSAGGGAWDETRSRRFARFCTYRVLLNRCYYQ